LAIRATTRTPGLDRRASRAISRFSESSVEAQITASAVATSAAARPVGDCSVRTSASPNSSMIRLASASSPQTMMWPDMAQTLLV
jgi:hypothetical protein